MYVKKKLLVTISSSETSLKNKITTLIRLTNLFYVAFDKNVINKIMNNNTVVSWLGKGLI